MSDLVSVIIPVHNVETYLRQCVESVLNSTHSNLQIVLVDDGSADKSGAICDAYEEKDHRITVIHEENHGVAEARNTGLAAAVGEYVSFVDSDDMIAPTMIETLLRAMEHTNADIAACEFTRELAMLECSSAPAPESLPKMNGMNRCIQVFSGEPSVREITWTGPMVWNKLYRMRNIKVKFRQTCVPAEDMQFNWEYVENQSSMVIVPQALYYWRNTPGSITHSCDAEKYVAISRVWINIAQKTNGADAALRVHLRYRAASGAHSALWRVLRSNLQAQHSEFCDQARCVIRQYFPETIAHQDTKLYAKMVYFLCRYCYPVWKLLPKTYEWLKRVFKI